MCVKNEMNCNDENGLQKIICDIGIGAWNVCKAVCFKVVCEGDFCMLLFVLIYFSFICERRIRIRIV